MPSAGAGIRSAFLFMDMNAPFLPLARKWRPQTFSELAGQDYAARVLQNAARQNRLHHAFLFTGTRGVGKTSLARIVAKMVNCAAPEDGAPCLKCPPCEQIAAGRLLDVVELDAASHTQVDKMRELLESAKYPPSQGKCKVFIIDEVHMLSKSAFAAMLKTLEEPPDYVKFVLATTDPQKLPATIMSRCLCFALRPLERGQIAGRLAEILDAEKRGYEEAAVRLIAGLARGSMRDALSIMEQALAHGGGDLAADAVRRITGETDAALLVDVLRAVAKADAAAVSEISRRINDESGGFDSALVRLAGLLYKTALSKAAPDSAADAEEAERIAAVSPLFSEEELQVLYEIALRGRRQLPWAPDEQTGFEMTLLRMALFAPHRAGDSAAAAPVLSAAGNSADSGDSSSAANSAADSSAAVLSSGSAEERWRVAVGRLEGSALALAQVWSVLELTEGKAVLRLDKSQKGSLLYLGELERQLRGIYGGGFLVVMEEGGDDSAAVRLAAEAESAAMREPFVREILESAPGAKLVGVQTGERT